MSEPIYNTLVFYPEDVDYISEILYRLDYNIKIKENKISLPHTEIINLTKILDERKVNYHFEEK